MENTSSDEKESWLVRNHIFFPLIIALGEAVTLSFLIKSFYEKSHEVTTHVLFAILLLLLIVACIFSFYYIKKAKKLSKCINELKKEKLELINIDKKNKMYKIAFKEINHAYMYIHKLHRIKGSSKDYVTALSNFCTHLADTFKNITGEGCSVCIKYTSFVADDSKNKEQEIAVKTLCRDIHSFPERGNQDNGTTHLLKHNTDFEEVFKKISEQHNNCFFCNDLTQVHAYGNSSFLKYGEESFKPFGQYTKPEDRSNAWKLPYKSTIVAPICPDIDERKKGEENKFVQGFLCIDSKSTEIFDSITDKEILLGCAVGLYNTVKEFKKLIEQEETEQLSKN
jgi:hypothetical protein